MQLKGSKTHDNLKAAFAGESQANRRYLYFAAKADVEVLALEDVASARVGHVLETLSKAGRQHALVVDSDMIAPKSLIDAPIRRTMVRGIFSISQLARQLGVSLQSVGEVARTFSEIEAALSR